jgi:formate hydrogenlyase subunit 5
MTLSTRTAVDADATTWADRVVERVAQGERFAGLAARAAPSPAPRHEAQLAPDRDAGIGGTELVALLGTGSTVEPVATRIPFGRVGYPSLTPRIPAAFWYERAVHDLTGVVPEGHPRLDPLVLPRADDAPLPDLGGRTRPDRIDPDPRALTRHVHGPGVFTIPHGPVRSGVFESVEYLVETPGEDIPHLRIRVHHKHRGVQKRFEGLELADGALLAERVEGIASVGHALAFAHAVERVTAVPVPRAAGLVRVLHAELERIANHLDVVIKLSDAAGLAVATARFGWHKERVMRLVSALCGNRFGRGVVVPGGVSGLPRWGSRAIIETAGELHHALTGDLRALMRSSSFLDRVRAAGYLTIERARRDGALGPIGRASGAGPDCRVTRPYDAYAEMHADLRCPERTDGDAQARLQVRIDEIHQSFALIERAADVLDQVGSSCPGRHRESGSAVDGTTVAIPVEKGVTGTGIGWAEAPQGEVLYLVDIDAGRVAFCAPRSASLHNLAMLPSTFRGDILTDFPFIEASFGLSIAGVVM